MGRNTLNGGGTISGQLPTRQRVILDWNHLCHATQLAFLVYNDLTCENIPSVVAKHLKEVLPLSGYLLTFSSPCTFTCQYDLHRLQQYF